MGHEAFRAAVVFEIEDFTMNSADLKERLLADAHADVRTALESANIDTTGLEFTPHPGGAQIVLPTSVEQTRLTDSCFQVLGARLAASNLRLKETTPLRLRVALAAGNVTRSSLGGWTGSAIDEGTLMVASAPARTALAESKNTVLALIVSESWFNSTVVQGRGTLRPDFFTPDTIRGANPPFTVRVASLDMQGLPVQRAPRQHKSKTPSPGKSVGPSGGGRSQSPEETVQNPPPKDEERRKWWRSYTIWGAIIVGACGIGATFIPIFLSNSGSSNSDPSTSHTATSASVAVTPSTVVSTTAAPPTSTAASVTGTLYPEVTDNHLGTDVFTDPDGDVPATGPGQIPYRTTVKVKCWAPNESGMGSINAFYLVETPPWAGEYAPADTFLNANAPGDGALDPTIPECS